MKYQFLNLVKSQLSFATSRTSFLINWIPNLPARKEFPEQRQIAPYKFSRSFSVDYPAAESPSEQKAREIDSYPSPRAKHCNGTTLPQLSKECHIRTSHSPGEILQQLSVCEAPSEKLHFATPGCRTRGKVTTLGMAFLGSGAPPFWGNVSGPGWMSCWSDVRLLRGKCSKTGTRHSNELPVSFNRRQAKGPFFLVM